MTIETKEKGINRNPEKKCEKCNQFIEVGARFYYSYNEKVNLPTGINSNIVMCEECYKKTINL